MSRPTDPTGEPRRLALLGRLDRYVLRIFLSALVVSAIVVVGLYLVVDLATNLDDFLAAEGGVSGREQLLRVGRYYAIEALFLLFQVAPFVTLAAGMYTVSRLQKNSELIAAMGLGWSVRRVQLPVFLAGMLLAVAMVGGRELATSGLGFDRDRLRSLLEEGGEEVVLELVRLKDPSGERVQLERYLPGDEPSGAGARFEGLDAIRFEEGLWYRYSAVGGVYRGVSGHGYWELEGGWLEEVEEGGKSRVPLMRLDASVEFSPRDVWSAWKGRNDALDLSWGEAAELSRRDPDNVQYATLLHYLVSFPLANVVLLLCGLPLMMQFERGRANRGLVLGFLLCVFYFGADFVSLNLGMQGHLSPLLATFLPPLFFGSLGAVLFASCRS